MRARDATHHEIHIVLQRSIVKCAIAKSVSFFTFCCIFAQCCR